MSFYAPPSEFTRARTHAPPRVAYGDLYRLADQRRQGYVLTSRCLPQFTRGAGLQLEHLRPVRQTADPRDLVPMHNVITDSVHAFFESFFGEDEPDVEELVVSREGFIVDGHQRHRAALNAGVVRVPVVRLMNL